MHQAVSLTKIARAKNNGEELAHFARNIGSNLFLTNRHLFADYKLGFNKVFSELSRVSPHEVAVANSACERASGIGPPHPPWQGGILPLNYARNVIPPLAGNVAETFKFL